MIFAFLITPYKDPSGGFTPCTLHLKTMIDFSFETSVNKDLDNYNLTPLLEPERLISRLESCLLSCRTCPSIDIYIWYWTTITTSSSSSKNQQQTRQQIVIIITTKYSSNWNSQQFVSFWRRVMKQIYDFFDLTEIYFQVSKLVLLFWIL